MRFELTAARVATRAAVTAATFATRGALLGRTEVAERVAELLVEEVLEAGGRHGCGAAAFARRSRVAAAVAATGRRIADDGEADLALLVDVVDAHLDLVTEIDDGFDLVDALALAQLADVQQAVTTGEDVHERTELGDVHDAALVDLAHVRTRRIEDQLDATTRFGHGGTIGRTDRDRTDHAVVVDRDVGAGLL